MPERFDATTVIDRPIEKVFEFLSDGTNDTKFSPRVQEIAKTTDGPVGVGTVFASTVKDAGMKTKREFKLTEYEAPTKIRWVEVSSNIVHVTDGGYDFAREGNGTKVTLFNVLEGKGFGKLILGFAARAARKDAPNFAARIKETVEREVPG